MKARVQAVRGMNDLLPEAAAQVTYIEITIAKLLSQYGYQKIILPIVEKTNLFSRSVGEHTDIVEKEMYSFEDRNGDSLALRPEGTAGCVRAGLEHGLLHNSIQRLWYLGPMFRHERPQKGRYRQFYQVGVEAYGMCSPTIDAELLILQYRLWQKLGLSEVLKLEINTLGSGANRKQFREALVQYCEQNHEQLDDDSKRRLTSNPLRILDSKNPALQELIKNAPKISDYLDDESKAHYAAVKQYLTACQVPYFENPVLVRGLDYYSHTVFEWTTDRLGAQGTVSAGGRYDKLVTDLGGQATGAVGFALGIERLALLMQEVQTFPALNAQPDIYFVVQAQREIIAKALELADNLRQVGMQVIVDATGAGFKSQFKKADQSKAALACVLGEQELQDNKLVIKNLRNNTTQQTVALDSAIDTIQSILKR